MNPAFAHYRTHTSFARTSHVGSIDSEDSEDTIEGTKDIESSQTLSHT